MGGSDSGTWPFSQVLDAFAGKRIGTAGIGADIHAGCQCS